MDYKFTFEDGSTGYLAHHGIKGMKWGVWNEETKARRGGLKESFKKLRDANVDESNKESGIPGMKWGSGEKRQKETLFVSGSSKTQDKQSGYYRKKLPREIRKELKTAIRNQDTVIVGDAPGVDRQVQDYLNKKRYANVEVYGPDIQPRYKAGKNWVFNAINDSKSKPGSKEWLAKKDIAMTNRATKGLAVTLDEGANATRRNVERLRSQGKDAVVYELSKKGKRKDRWVDSKDVRALE